MPAKVDYNLSDEHPDIRKQMGCMNGIFQLFDRHHFLSGSQRYIGQHQKRLPSPGVNGNIATEEKRASPRTVDKRGAKEKHGISTESSRTSFSSSSCSSSLSSLESTRLSQLDTSSLSQSITTDRRDLPTMLPSWKSSDFRDVVKDSIYRETREISVKTAGQGKAGGRILKYIDSPRPVQQQKIMEQKPQALRESTLVLHQPQDTPCTSIGGTHNSSLKDVRRFSLDGRELRENYKSSMKIKELPRFSLDSRAGSLKGSTAEMRSYTKQEMGRSGNSTDSFTQQEPGSNRRQSSVVAKLMGLEALPDSTTTNSNQATQFGLQDDALSRSSRTINEHYQNHNASSPRYHNKELTSPRPETADSIKKHPAISKSSIAPASWNRLKASQGSPSPGSTNQVAQEKSKNSSVSVYGEIEKRLGNLEFKRSGKDLRALKQILEAMQKNKATFEIKSDDGSGWVSQSSRIGCHEFPMEKELSGKICSSPARGKTAAESSTSSIVIIKPAKLSGRASYPTNLANHTNVQSLGRSRVESTGNIKKPSINSTATRDPTLKTNNLVHGNSHPTRFGDRSTNSRLIKSPSARNEPPSPTKESTIVARNFGIVNSKNQENKFGVEKKSHPTTPTDSNKSSKQLTQTGLCSRKPGTKFQSMLLGTDLNCEVRDLSQQETSISQQSESNASMASQIDEEVSSLDKSEKIKTVLQQRRARKKEPAANSTDEKLCADISIPSEQPSPVSVLEAKFYNDELPSPIRKISTSLKGIDSDDEIGWENNNARQSSTSMISESSVLDHKRVGDIKAFIQHLQQLSSAKEPITTELALYNHSSSDHRYILEIVLASSFLRDLERIFEVIQLNPTDDPIKPSFFLVLEEAKASLKKTDGLDKEHPKLAKIQRKLLFDFTNEILLQKLSSENSIMIGNSQIALTQKVPKGGLPLCQELLSELDKLQDSHLTSSFDNEEHVTNMLSEDMMQQSANWTKGLTEVPGLVLDLERMIFKDLITEVLTQKMSRLQMRPAAHRRQLFF